MLEAPSRGHAHLQPYSRATSSQRAPPSHHTQTRAPDHPWTEKPSLDTSVASTGPERTPPPHCSPTKALGPGLGLGGPSPSPTPALHGHTPQKPNPSSSLGLGPPKPYGLRALINELGLVYGTLAPDVGGPGRGQGRKWAWEWPPFLPHPSRGRGLPLGPSSGLENTLMRFMANMQQHTPPSPFGRPQKTN